MNFQDAITRLKQGNKIKRPAWYKIWMQIIDDEVKYFDVTIGNFVELNREAYAINSEDVLAEDWEIVSD
jgi:hypothetical protein